jgi:ribosomal-protein-alanine N-acetyltransferase
VTIRPLLLRDAEELAAIYRANREFLASNEPVRPPDFFTAEGQRQRIEERAADGFHQFAILEGSGIAGTINLFHIVREALQSGTIGYWVDHPRNGQGATLVDNLPSQRVLEKNRFERIGLARDFLRIDGEWRDFLLFQRLADS